MRAMPELLVLLRGAAAAVRSFLFAILLLTVFLYVAGLGFRQSAKGTSLESMYFSSVPHSVSTLIVCVTAPDLLSTLQVDFMVEHAIYAISFFMIVLMASCVVMNMLLGVLVQVVGITWMVEKERTTMLVLKDYIRDFMHKAGISNENTISQEEFCLILQKPETMRALHGADIDAVGLLDRADFLFDNKDCLDLPDFMESLLQLRGSNTATGKDIVDARKLISVGFKSLEERLSKIEGTLDRNKTRKRNNLVSSQFTSQSEWSAGEGMGSYGVSVGGTMTSF
jgi:hypothetical protein